MGKWETVRLGDVCSLITDGTHQTPEYCNANEGYPFLSSKDVTTEVINWDDIKYIPKPLHEQLYKRLAPQVNDILLAKNGTTGVAALVDINCIFDIYVSLALLRPSERIYPPYLLRVINSPLARNQFSAHLKGIGVPNLHLSEIRNTKIPLPPLGVQQKIADVLDKASALIELRRAQLGKLDLLIKSQFVEMFGDPVINQKQFPIYTVDDIIEFQGGSQPDKKYFEYKKTDDNIRLIQIRDYKSDRFITYIPKTMAKRFCTAEDIMIGRYGPPIFQILQGIDGAFNVALMKATPRKGNREFVRNFLKQECLLHYLEGLSQRTAGQDGIQMDKLKDYPFPYPPIEIQNEFATFVKQVEEKKKLLQQSLSKLELNYKSLMQKCFRGEIF